jgi:hypothetical protein
MEAAREDILGVTSSGAENRREVTPPPGREHVQKCSSMFTNVH